MPNEAALGTAASGTSAPAAALPVDAPVLPTDSSIFDGWAKANEAMLGDAPEGAAAAPAEEPETPAIEQPNTDEPAQPEQTKEGTDGEEQTASPDAEPAQEQQAEAEAVAPVVEFAEDEPFESFSEKVEQFFDAYEVDPSLLAIKSGYEKQIAALQEQVGGQVEINENVKAAVEAFSAIDEFRKDDQTGVFIPKTNEAVAFVQATKPPEVFKQFVVDAMAAPSPKYRHLGLTMLHEMLIDQGVPPSRMEEAVSYITGEAQIPAKYPDLPTGVPQEVAEAYLKNSALRQVIEDCGETLDWSEADRQMYPDQYIEAKTRFDDAVAALVASQKDINADRDSKSAAQQKAINDQNAFNQTVLAGTQEIQKAELMNFRKDLQGKLSPFISDKAALELTSLTYEQLMVNVLADDVYGADARAVLKAQGIDIPFSKAQALFQQIHDAVAQRELILRQTGDEKAANKGVEKQLTNALRELGVMRRQVIGKVAQVVTKSYTNGELKPATAKPQLRPQLKGGRGADGQKGGNMPDFHDPQAAGKWYGETLFNRGEG